MGTDKMKLVYIDCYCARCMSSPERKEYEREKNKKLRELMDLLPNIYSK